MEPAKYLLAPRRTGVDDSTMVERRQPSLHPDTSDREEGMPTVYLKPGEADRVLSGHPWVYEASILRLTREAADGDAVQVKDHRRRFLGIGLYNSRSRIRVRVLTANRCELDEMFFEGRIRAALDHRRRFLPGATSLRVVNAEGDLLSGLIVDKYEDVLVVQMSSLGMDRRKTMLTRVLRRVLNPRAILERNDMGARKFEGLPDAAGLLAGELSDSEMRRLPVRLGGLSFEVDLRQGHKTGLYLDQQLNYGLVENLVPRGGRVLDAFCFVGGFALHAARAGAEVVKGIDQSEEAIDTATRLAAANRLSDPCAFQAANVFDWLRLQRTPPADGATEPLFDLIILDPPSFTRTRAAVPDALRGYKEIHLRSLRLLRPGGLLVTFCCSHHVDAETFEGVVLDSALDARRQLRRIALYTQAPDHPILPAVRETAYLKGFAFELLSP